jgi:UDP-glucuronate decarboxylase
LTTLNLLSEEEIHSISGRVNFERFANKRVVITGASGLVGGYLTYALIKCTAFLGDDAPEVIAVSKSGNFPNLCILKEESKLAFLSLDLEKDEFDFDYEVLIHAASAASPTIKITREAIFNVNCNILRNLLSNRGLVEKILFISTGEVYGAEAPAKVTENFIGKLDTSTYRANYPEAKLAGEKLALSLNDVGVDGRVARLFHSFGPGLRIDDGRSFADFLWSASFGNSPILRTTGTQIRSFLYLEDSIVGLLNVLDSNICTPINVGSENELSILQFASRVSAIAGLGGEVVFQSNESETVYSPNTIVLPSNELLRSTGWSQQVNLDLGIERTINWIRNNGAAKA